MEGEGLRKGEEEKKRFIDRACILIACVRVRSSSASEGLSDKRRSVTAVN